MFTMMLVAPAIWKLSYYENELAGYSSMFVAMLSGFVIYVIDALVTKNFKDLHIMFMLFLGVLFFGAGTFSHFKTVMKENVNLPTK
jgi:hypothetical protein